MLTLRQSALYKQVYTDDVLTESWRRVRTGTDQSGVDGVTVASFQAQLFANLKALQTILRQQRYQPQPGSVSLSQRATVPGAHWAFWR
jgi:hypothetical protein